jgi:hypothetical protein
VNPDPLAPARGIAWGLVFGSLTWAVILPVVWLVLR